MPVTAADGPDATRARVGDTELTVVQDDLTAQLVDAIVNAANTSLLHGGGVAGAIVREGGAVIQEESDAWRRQHGELQRGQAAVTSAGSLPARHVIHVAGPVHRGTPDDEAHLRDAVRGALDAAAALGAVTVALPAISSGTYGYPLEAATRTIVAEAAEWARANAGRLREIRFVALDEDAVTLFRRAVAEVAA